MLSKTYNKAVAIALQPFRLLRNNKQFNPSESHNNDEEKNCINSSINIYQYNTAQYSVQKNSTIEVCNKPVSKDEKRWINLDGIHQHEVEAIAKNYNIHALLIEDILSKGQRAKADNIDNQLFCLLPMLRYNTDTGIVLIEQISMVLGSNYVLTFQEEPNYDPFDNIRKKIETTGSAIRLRESDYLFYTLIDAIVDQYFNVLDYLVARLEKLEDEVVVSTGNSNLIKISLLRREIMLVKRSIGPVRELINALMTTDSNLIDKKTKKYFKDIYDHILLAIEYTENYRDMVVSLQDLNMNKVNTKMNEVMKTLTIVTTLLAPATVIGGIFGMNFEKIPFSQHPLGFYATAGLMLLIALLMLLYFKKRKWF